MARPAQHHPAADETIVACATGAGPAALAIVRLSGPAAHRIARALAPTLPADVAPGMLRRATLRSASGPIDDALVVLWKAPASATGEDIAELHLHGAPAIVRSATEAAVAAGARPAEPGEFTRRAFLNGRIDLAAAESIAALSAARTEAAARGALAGLRGGVGERARALRAALVPLAAQLDAAVDFSDQDLPDVSRGSIAAELERCIADVAALLATARRGRSLREGARVALVGAPNAGKSSLFNALLGRERAIVSPHPGTTRDTIEAEIELRGFPVTLVDTAGLREDAADIEALGIARSREEAGAAALVLLVADASADTAAARRLHETIARQPHIVVANKADLAAAGEILADLGGPGRHAALAVSARTGEGLPALEAAIAAFLGGEGECGLTSTRQEAEFRAAHQHLVRAQEALAGGLSPEFPATDIVEAMARLDRVAPGAGAADEDILDAIFAMFCLGK